MLKAKHIFRLVGSESLESLSESQVVSGSKDYIWHAWF